MSAYLTRVRLRRMPKVAPNGGAQPATLLAQEQIPGICLVTKTASTGEFL